MGGLIALYAGLTHSETFGFVGSLSPSVHFAEHKLQRLAMAFTGYGTKFHLDYGAQEFAGDTFKSKSSFVVLEELAATLNRRGARARALLDPAGTHNETSWSRRLEDVLKWFHE
jgi:predicted alpha/beta superfamily hydrolase